MFFIKRNKETFAIERRQEKPKKQKSKDAAANVNKNWLTFPTHEYRYSTKEATRPKIPIGANFMIMLTIFIKILLKLLIISRNS